MGGAVTTVAAMLAARAEDDRPAVVDAVGAWTWREAVAEGATRGALALSLFGDAKPHVGVLLPNGPEYLFWLNGAALAGAAIVGINPTRRGEALAADVRATDCAVIVTDAEGAALLEGLSLGVSDDRILVTGTERYGALLAEFAGSEGARALVDRADEIDEDALYLLIFTSGTTGVPKAVRCTQGRLAGIAEVAAPGYGYTGEDICYCPMPLFHGNALMALWGPAVMVGAAIATRPRFSASAFIDDVRTFGATKFSYVGKAIAYILATPERPDDADNTLKSAFGTEASVRDRDRFRKRFGCYLIEGYGQSEGGAAINPVLGMPKGALGKPVDAVDLAVISPETGEECPPAQFDAEGRLLNAGEAIGEIVNRSGPGKFEGYYQREDAEAERLRRGWYWTGDLGYVDAEGFFYFAGRTGDWLRVDSENFAAGPVEAVLSRHPDLSVVAVYPVPDTASGAGDQVMLALETVPGRPFDPDGVRRMAGGPARPRTEVGAPLRAGLGLAPPDGHREGDQGGAAVRGVGLRRPGLVATSRQVGDPVPAAGRRGPGHAGGGAGRERPAGRGRRVLEAEDPEDAGQLPDAVVPGLEGRRALSEAIVLPPHVDCGHARTPRSTHVGPPGVPDEDDLTGVDLERLGGLGVDAGVRLACPGPRRGHSGVDELEEADLVEVRIELPAPIGADADGQPRLPQGHQSRPRLGVGDHAALVRGPQLVDHDVDVGAVHAGGVGEVTQTRPDPRLVGLLADRVLGVVDAVVAGEVAVEDGGGERVAVGGEHRGVIGGTGVRPAGEGPVEVEDDGADHGGHIACRR